MRHRFDLRHLGQMLCRHHRVILPAGIAEHDVARSKALRVGRNDLGDAAAGHDRVGLDRRAVGRAVHPGPVSGVQRDIAHPQQHLALLRLRDGAFEHFEMLRPEFPGRLFNQQDLAIDSVVHRVPSVCRFLMQLAAQKTLSCTHGAQRTTLVGRRSFHNGNIVANAPNSEPSSEVFVMVNLLQPGSNFPGTLPDKAQSTGLPVSAFSIEKFLTHLIPTSIADAMAQNEILQIVVFAVFFSVAMGDIPERSNPMLAVIDDLGHIMLKVTGYVMLFAPLAVWAAIMATVSKNGLGVLWKLIQFMGGFYLSLAILWAILVVVGFIVIGPRYIHLLRLIREPLMIAFSTASSEAAYPKTPG